MVLPQKKNRTFPKVGETKQKVKAEVTVSGGEITIKKREGKDDN